MSRNLQQLLEKQQIIVCCGAGGVGKTSTSAALALAAARAGRRVLVITIDPAKRLSESLGVAQNPDEPVLLAAPVCAKLGITAPGSLATWLLDPQQVANKVVRRLAKDAQEAETLLSNVMYQNISAMVAGMQEYTAVQAMYEFVSSHHYDLIVLDTPPSRNALNFLQAPKRITHFMDGRVFKLFLPDSGSLVKKASSMVVNRVLDLTFGAEARRDLTTFFDLFSHILKRLSSNADDLQSLFRRPDVSFLVVTSPDQAAVEDADYFGQKSRDELELPLAGYIFNKSLVAKGPRPSYKDVNPPISLTSKMQAVIDELAAIETRQLKWEEGQYEQLVSRLRRKEFIVRLPAIDSGVSDLDSLLQMAKFIAQDDN